jgi:hypothetical protein
MSAGSVPDDGAPLLYTLSRAFSALITLDELLPSIMLKTKEVLQAESCALLRGCRLGVPTWSTSSRP